MKSAFSDKLKHGLNAWESFWFYSESAKPIRVFRFLLGLILFLFYLSRTLDLDFFYSDQGVLPLSAVADIIPSQYRLSLLFYFKNSFSIFVLHSLFLVSLLTMALGVFPRISAGVSLILHLSFLHRNMGVGYGVDSISTFLLFCLSFANSESGGAVSSIFESLAFRLLQLQVCIIYGYSGFEKLKGMLWWRGEALWYALANVQITRFDFSWISHFPLMIVIGTYSTVLWEVYFPIAVWIKPVRKYVLVFGVFLHLAIAITVYIPYFAALMISTYVLFLDLDRLNRLTFYVGQAWKTGLGYIPKKFIFARLKY